MMNEFYDNAFERFLKENVEQYKMYPSDNVWDCIYSNLHFGSRILGFSFTLLMLSLGTFSIYLLNYDKNEIVHTTQTELTMPVDLFKTSIKTFAVSSINTKTSSESINTVYIPVVNDVLVMQPESNGILEPVIPVDHTDVDLQKETSEIKNEEIIKEEEFSLSNSVVDDLSAAAQIVSKINELPLAIPAAVENALNNITVTKKKNKTSLQFYFTPTITTRKLTENKSYILNGSNSLLSITNPNTVFFNVNDYVNHTPEVGAEFGLAAIIPFSKNINLRAGVQLNISRYSIKAFNAPGDIATYALNRGTRVDNMSMMSNYRNNQNGFNPDYLHNFYFQISAPIGFEYHIAKSNKVQFGISGTVQPTFLLKNSVYLLSVDYKNYTEVPWLVRKVNANTSIQPFVSYSTGKLNWQIGPQIRYQLLSSYVDTYPVKENLFNYGFKIGASLNR